MKQQLMNRIYAEHAEFLAELKQKPSDEIISKAYEICYREEFILILEHYNFADCEVEILLQLHNPVAFLYDEWLKTDAGVGEMLKEVITNYLYEENQNG